MINTEMKYCIGCRKHGHFTNECWSTTSANTSEAIELMRLCRIANAQTKDKVENPITTAPPAGEMPALPEPDGSCEVIVGQKLVGNMMVDVVKIVDGYSAAKVNTFARQYHEQQAGADAELRVIGSSMAAVMFNLAQREGDSISAAHVEIMNGLRRQWDTAIAAQAQKKEGV